MQLIEITLDDHDLKVIDDFIQLYHANYGDLMTRSIAVSLLLPGGIDNRKRNFPKLY